MKYVFIILYLFPLAAWSGVLPQDTIICVTEPSTKKMVIAFREGGVKQMLEVYADEKDCYNFEGGVTEVAISEPVGYKEERMRLIIADTIFNGEEQPTRVYIFLIKRDMAV